MALPEPATGVAFARRRAARAAAGGLGGRDRLSRSTPQIDARSTTDAERAEHTSWRLLAASVPGRTHLLRGEGNEDAVATEVLDDGTVLIALADGAGSAEHAALGARTAVTAAVASLRSRKDGPGKDGAREDWHGALHAALGRARRELAAAAREMRSRPRDLACTLLVAVIADRAVAVLQLGDGAIFVRSEGSWQRAGRPLRGPHAGETVFVTGRRAGRLAQVDMHALEGIDALALMTDGLEPVATDLASGDAHAPFLDPLLAFAGGDREPAELELELARFLAGDRIQSRSGDDLSLVLALRQ